MNGTRCALDGCSFRYASDESADGVERGVHAIDHVSLQARAGEVVMLVGRSGCGKTTVTRLLNGLAPEYFRGSLHGEARVGGLHAGVAAVEDYATEVGSVFQNPKTQYFHANSTDELAFPCENAGMEPSEIRRRIRERLRAFDVEHLHDRNIVDCSGGQQQQLAVVAATMLDPGVLVLDEPTSNLDAEAMERLRNMVKRLKRDGIAIVIAEHRLAWVADLADRYVVFDAGRVVGEYTAEHFHALPESQRRAWGLRALELSGPRGQVERIAQRAEPSGEKPVIATRGLKVGYERRRLFGRTKRGFVREVGDVNLFAGQIVGLIGRNGAGKSTFVKTVCGLVEPVAGEILVDGRAAKPGRLSALCAMVMQDVNYQLFASSVREEMLLEAMQHVRTAEDAQRVRERADGILRQLGLLDFAERHPMTLSGGQKQRLAIGVALMGEKRVVVLDEPTSGLDRHHMLQVGALMRDLADRGVCVLVVTHDDELAAEVCDRIVRF